ncbi:hypothetical protein MRQ47_004433 [Salmonella enterica]|nr:hypothetical protein [Salmonella enterica]
MGKPKRLVEPLRIRNRDARRRIVLALVAEGRSTREIGQRMGVTSTDAATLIRLAQWEAVKAKKEAEATPEEKTSQWREVRRRFYNRHKPEILELNPFNVVPVC